jgi:hypothetical protein
MIARRAYPYESALKLYPYSLVMISPIAMMTTNPDLSIARWTLIGMKLYFILKRSHGTHKLSDLARGSIIMQLIRPNEYRNHIWKPQPDDPVTRYTVLTHDKLVAQERATPLASGR